MSKGFEGTRGPWTVRAGLAVGAEVVGKKAKGGDYVVARCSGSDRDLNAALIAEAGNIANTTGLTPLQLAEQRAELLEALRGLYDELERDHYGADYAPEPDEPMGIAKAALATQRKEPGA